MRFIIFVISPESRSVQSTGLLPLACWDCGSIPAGALNFCLLWMLCVVRYRSLPRADHPSREILPSVVCHNCDCAASIMRPWPTIEWCAIKKNYLQIILISLQPLYVTNIFSPVSHFNIHPNLIQLSWRWR